MTTYQPTESALSFLLKTIQQYQEPSYFLYAAAFLFLAAAVTGGRRVRLALIWPALILFATVFNPYLFPVLFVEQGKLVEKYYMFLWALPAVFVAAAGVTALACRFSLKPARALLYAGALAALVLTGTPKLTAYTDILLPASLMKADPELVTICEYLSGNASLDNPLVAFERRDFAEEAMAFDASLRISGILDGREPSEVVPGGEDYIVLKTNSGALAERLHEFGYREIAHTPDSFVFAREQ